jgi:ectoine hydroxylase
MTTTLIRDVYPSRKKDRAESIDRVDPVVHTPESEWANAPLSIERTLSFQENGFLFLEDFFSHDRIAECLEELDRLRSSESFKKEPSVVTEPTSNEVRSIFAVHELGTVFEKFYRDPLLLRTIQFLLNDSVYIHQSRVNFKPGFEGKEFYWHSDFETWHMEDGMPRMRAVSASITLTPNHILNGPLMLIPGSQKRYIACVGQTPEEHYKESLKKQEYGVPDRASLEAIVRDGSIEAPTGAAGSVILFECNTMHGSNGNITPWPRSNLFFVYNAIANSLTDPYCGLEPRPEFVATRRNFEPLGPISRG